MTLYTRTGDDGSTGVPGASGGRVRKDDPRTTALGSVDELNAAIGLCLTEAVRITHLHVQDLLNDAQRRLLDIGSILAHLGGRRPAGVTLDGRAVEKMEKDIDSICADLPELKHFILPGGSELAARLHVARAVSRRAERAVVSALEAIPAGAAAKGERPALDSQAREMLTYLNRLSDLLFALARLANRDAGENDVVWIP